LGTVEERTTKEPFGDTRSYNFFTAVPEERARWGG